MCIRDSILILICTSSLVFGQEIALSNASFEGIPHKGIPGGPKIEKWFDCGRMMFPDESPPDLHPLVTTEIRQKRTLYGIETDTVVQHVWKVNTKPSEGKTFLGMVVRSNDTWEAVSQRLPSTLEADKCYSFNIELSRSQYYVSGVQGRRDVLGNITEENYTQPAVLRIWGGRSICGKKELLGESVTVSNDTWRTYEFEFRPNSTVNYITLETFYKVPTLIPYNGHLLLDNASSIKRIPCDENEELETEAEEVIAVATPNRTKPPTKTAPTPVSESLSSADITAMDMTVQEEPVSEPKKKILPELSADSYRKGQIIRIKDIYFEHDSSSFNQQSLAALDEIVDFLKRKDNIVIEVGGHTSTVPSQRYCDDLSSRRAKAVATYIAKNGISTKRLSYKGYGKRKPIIPNDRKDMEARKKNQRVELKVLKTDYKSS